jgi:hypothetical protein
MSERPILLCSGLKVDVIYCCMWTSQDMHPSWLILIGTLVHYSIPWTCGVDHADSVFSSFIFVLSRIKFASKRFSIIFTYSDYTVTHLWFETSRRWTTTNLKFLAYKAMEDDEATKNVGEDENPFSLANLWTKAYTKVQENEEYSEHLAEFEEHLQQANDSMYIPIVYQM